MSPNQFNANLIKQPRRDVGIILKMEFIRLVFDFGILAGGICEDEGVSLL